MYYYPIKANDSRPDPNPILEPVTSLIFSHVFVRINVLQMSIVLLQSSSAISKHRRQSKYHKKVNSRGNERKLLNYHVIRESLLFYDPLD